MSLTIQGFTALVDRIEATGVPRELAGHYAALIGDTPRAIGKEVIVFEDILDEAGHALPFAMRELARLPISVLGSPWEEEEDRAAMTELRFSNGATVVRRAAWPPGFWRLEISGPPVPSLNLNWPPQSPPESFIQHATEAAQMDGLTVEVRTREP